MKVAVAFFGKKKNNIIKNIYKKHNKITVDFKIITYLIVISTFFYIFAKFVLISPNIVYFTTNFRQANKSDLKFANIIQSMDIYNSKNYMLKAKADQNDKKSKENENNIADANKNEYSVIDSMVEKFTDKEVFFNNKPSINITENSTNIQRVSVGDMKILNYSGKRDIDFSKLYDGNVTLTKKSDKILIYNTHTSESYTNSEKYKFDYTGTMRTTDANYNMLFISKILTENLKNKGLDVIQNTTPHDYGTYTSSYSKSRITVKQAILDIGGVGISIDVHRDAVTDLRYRPVANVNGIQVAQCMFVIGVGTDVNKNEYWEDNLRLAIKLQKIADDIYPGLFKPMIVRNSIYNQDLNKFSILIEIGATGNPIEEVLLSTRCLTNVLNILYKD